MFDVISIGTATQDVFLRLTKNETNPSFAKATEGEPLCFQSGSKNEVEKPVFATGGGAVNAAVTFSRQGLKTAALFRVGEDQSGENLWKEMRDEDIHFWKIIDSNIGTAYATILLSINGERTILTYRGAAEGVSLKEIPFDQLKTRWAAIFPSYIDVGAMGKIIDHFYFQGTLITFNPSKFYLEKHAYNLRPFLDKIKVLFVNREEAAQLTGASPDNEKALFKKLDKLVKGIAVMTDGPRGVWVSSGQEIYHAGVFMEKIIADRTGAGDAFASGFVAGLIQKDDIEYAIRLGSANATSVVEQIGAHIGSLTKKQFEEGRRWHDLKVVIHKS